MTTGAFPSSEAAAMDVDTPSFYPAPIIRTEIGPPSMQPIEFKEREVKIQGAMSRRDRLMRSPDESDNPSAEEVTQLNMTGLPIQSFSDLRNYKNLTKLVWRNLSNEDLALLLLSYANPNITYLDLSRDVCDESKLQMEHIRKKDIVMGVEDEFGLVPITGELPRSFISKNLTYLNVSGTIRLTDRKRKFQMPTSKGWRSVDVGNKRLRYMVENHPHLTELHAACTGMTSVDELTKLTALTALDVSNNYLTGQDFREIIYRFPSIKRLNISRNELGDGDVQLLLDPEYNFPFVELDVSNQKINYINPQILEILRDLTKAEADDQIRKEESIDYTTYWFKATTADELKNVYKNHPNLQILRLGMGQEYRRPEDMPDLHLVSKFKHLRSLYIGKAKKLPAFIFKLQTCIEIDLFQCSLKTKSIGQAIRSNDVLKRLDINNCIVPEKTLLLILQNQSITNLNFTATTDDAKHYYNRAKFIEQILKNESLLEFKFLEKQLTGEAMPHANLVDLTRDEQKLIEAHLNENGQKLQILEMLPLIAATQLGGPLRHSVLRSDILPMISRFMDQRPLKQDTNQAISELIEPQIKLGRRTRQQTAPPLPLMFDPVLYEKAKQ